MIDTRKSMARPLIFSLKRPSWGMRFSAMSSSDMTLMREMIEEWKRLSIGSMALYRTPSMRYLMITSRSRVSMWMSEARRCSALKTVESTSLMIGESACVSLSIDSASSPSSSLSRMTWILNSSVAASSTRWLDSDFFRTSLMAVFPPTQMRSGLPSRISSSSTISTSDGSESTTTSLPSSSFQGMKL